MNLEKLEKILIKIVYWASAAMVLVPLLAVRMSYFPYVYYKGVAIFWLTEIALAAHVVLFFSNKKYRPQFKTMEWLMLGFGAVYIITSIFGLCFNRSWWGDWGRFEGAYLILHFIAWFFVLVNVVKEKADWHKLFKISIGVSLLVAFLGFLQILGVKIAILPQADRIGSTLGNAGYYSSYALMSLFLSVYLWFASGLNKARWYYFAVMAVNLIAVILTGTRGALIGLGVAIIYYVFIILKKRLYKDAAQKIFFYISVIAVLLGIFLIILGQTSYIKNNRYLSRFADFNLRTTTAQTRFQAWQYGWQGFKENWLLGVGPENYNIVYDAKFQPIMYSLSKGEIWFERAHNKLIDQAVMTGILGLALYLLIYAFLFVCLNKSYKKGKLNFAQILALRLLLIAYFIQNLFLFDNHSTYILYFLIIGFIIVQTKDGNVFKSHEELMSPAKAIKLTAIVLVVLLTFSLVNIRFLRANYFAIKALDSRYSNSEMFHQYFQKAVELSINPIQLANDYATQAADLYVQGWFRNIPKENLTVYLNRLAFYQEENDRLDPLNLFSSYQYFKTAVNLYEATEDQKWQEKAEYLVNKSITASPNNIRPWWQKFQLDYDINKDAVKGRDDLDKAIAIAPKVGDSYWLMALMYLLEKDNDLGYQFADQAIDYSYNFKLDYDIQLVIGHYYEKQDWPRVEKLLISYLKLRSTEINIYFSLAEVYALDDNVEEAINILKRVLIIDPTLTDKVVGQIESLKQQKNNP